MTRNATIQAGRRSETRTARALAALDRMSGGGTAKEATLGLSGAAQAWLRGVGGGSAAALHEPLRPYQQVLWVYRCVRKIQESGSGVPLRLMREGPEARVRAKSLAADIRRSRRRTLRPVAGRKAVCTGRAADGEIVEEGDARAILDRPNGYQDWPAFLTAHIGWLLTAGSVAWIYTDLKGRRPGEVHVFDGRRVTPIWRRTPEGIPILAGYEFSHPETGARLPLALDECRYFALWTDGKDPLGGMSPLTPGRLAVATDYNASYFNAAMLANGADPGIAIKPGTLTPEQRDELRAVLAERYQGPMNARRPLILENGEVQVIGSTMADLQFDQGKRTTRLEICCLYGVPPVVAGWVDAAGDSSAYTSNALRQFWQETMFPLLDSIAPAVQDLVSRFDSGLLAWFDVEDLPVVQEMRLARLDSAKKYFDLSYPPNRINDLLDLGMPDQPWGDIGYLPSGLLPAADVAAGGGFSPVPEGPPAGEETDGLGQAGAGLRIADCGSRIENEQRDARGRIWRAWARSWAPLAQQVRQVLRSHYFEQERRARAALNAQMQNAECRTQNEKTAEKTVQVDALLIEIFQDPKMVAAFRARIFSALKDGRELGLRQALAESGLAGDALAEALRRLLANPGPIAALRGEAILLSKKIDATTREALKRSLQEGLDAGESFPALASRLDAQFGHRRGTSMMMARNVVGQVLSKSRHEGVLSTGMTHKLWLHTRAPEAAPRPGHVAAEAVYAAEPCPISDPFVVEGDAGPVRLMYPRDPSGPPGEIVNCQCLAIYKRFAEGERADVAAMLKGRETAGFVGFKDVVNARAASPAHEHGEKAEV